MNAGIGSPHRTRLPARARPAPGTQASTLRDPGRTGWTLRALPRPGGGGQANISVRKLASLAVALGTTPSELSSHRHGKASARFPSSPFSALRGAGKTTIGRRPRPPPARVPFVGTLLDRRVEEAAGPPYRRALRPSRRGLLRPPGAATLDRVLRDRRGRSSWPPAAGHQRDPRGRPYAVLRRQRCLITIWLRADPEDHWNRASCSRATSRRPMAGPPGAGSDGGAAPSPRRAPAPLRGGGAQTAGDPSGADTDEVVRRIEGLVGPYSPPRPAKAS